MPPSKLPFESDVESVITPDEPVKKRGRKPTVKRQAPTVGQRKRKQTARAISSESESDVEDTPQPVKRGRKTIKKKPTPKKPTRPEEDSVSDTDDCEETTSKRCKSAILDESEDEKTQPIIAHKLQNLLWRKVASGYTSQRDFSKKGDFYIEFRISYSDDAETKDGYKKLLISFKSYVDKKSDVYKAAEKFVAAAKQEYKHITPLLYPKNE